MANSLSVKVPIISGYNEVLNSVIAFSGTLASLILSSSEVIEWEIYLDKEINSLTRLASISLSAVSSGGTIPRDTVIYVRVTTVDVNGVESAPTSVQSKKTGSSSTSKIAVSWVAIIDAVAYRVYASTKPGSELFIGETTTLTFDVTYAAPPVSFSIPTSPDIYVNTLAGSSSINLSGVLVAQRFAVYIKATTSGIATFSTIIS